MMSFSVHKCLFDSTFFWFVNMKTPKRPCKLDKREKRKKIDVTKL